jgi:SAM-dependent methyltransferase
LHHSCLEPAFSEASRVLKKEGKAVFIEPLGYNPLISIYRKMAKSVRTINETPLKYNDIKITKRFFSSVRFEYFWFFSLFIFIYMYIVERIHPSSQRYWKRIISQSEKYRALFRPLNYFDCLLLKVFPFMGRFCWNIVIILEDKIKAPLYG